MTSKTKTTVEAATKGFDHTVANLKGSVEQATAGFAQTHAQVQEGMEKAMKTTEELVAFGQGNFEAFTKAGQIWTAGVQDISKQFAATAQVSLDETLSLFKAFGTVKSLKDLVELQSSLTRTSLEKAVAETTKLTDASLKLTEQALAPITARVTLAIEKFSKAA